MRSYRTAAALALALALLAPSAQATYNPLASGQTKLIFAKGFLALLKENGVKLAGVEGAVLKGGTASFPLSGGKLDPTTSKGTVEHGGALLFKAGGRSLSLDSLQLKTTQRHAPLSAKLGGGQLKLASTEKLTLVRAGFGEKITAPTLKLAAKLATRLNKKLGLKGVFEAGQPLGRAVTQANPQTIALAQSGKASFTLDPATAAKLQSLFVAVNPIFPAEHPADFTLPIFGGTIAPDASLGAVETQGAIELTQIGGGQVFLREGWLELGASAYSAELELAPSPPYPGKQGRVPVAALSLAGASVSADPAARTVAVAGATLSMQANLAAALNEAFAKPQGKPDAFTAGEQLGTVSFGAAGE